MEPIDVPDSRALFNCSLPCWLTAHHQHRFLIISLTNGLCPLVSGVAPFWARIENHAGNEVRKSLRLLSDREKKHPTNWNRDGEALLRNASTHDLETWVQRHGRPVVNTDPACMTCHNSYMDLGPQIASSCICPLTIYMMLRSCVPISWEFYGVCRCDVRGAWVSSQNIW